ncbi:MAG: hypothetical protein IKL49_03705 [Lachnospiraceae bacterium]|nr:hypothetical protein [Lachnospiraceae bacterium]
MDKQEYKLRAEEIKSLIAKRDFFGAVKIADEIDWTRVRSVAMLCTVSDLYKANRRYKESKELLLMAYERHPNGRMIVYSLCELCIKMGEMVQAMEYYKEFVQLAPMDNGRYILQYKLYVANEVSLEERIAVLEELKKRDYREKWGYELAYLYHRVGLATKCVEECDELILWFSDGRYVKKAMELKMLHQPLTVAQEASYNAFIGKNAELPKPEPVVEKPIEDQIKEPTVNVGQYDTINLQKALAESMKEVLSPVVSDPVVETEEESELMGDVTGQIMASMFQDTSEMKEVYFEDNTEELVPPPAQMEELIIKDEIEEETAEAEEEIAETEEVAEVEELSVTEEVAEVEELPVTEEVAEVEELPVTEEVAEVEELSEIEKIVEEEALSETEEETSVEEAVPAMAEAKVVRETEKTPVVSVVEPRKIEVSLSGVPFEVPTDATKEIPSIREIMGRPLVPTNENVVMKAPIKYTEDGIPSSMADLLSQEYDGQIGLVIEEGTKVEKQITGQMNIQEVLEEWEKTKKDYEEKRKAELTQKVLEQTGSMFTEFEEKARDGILEQLQKEMEEEETEATTPETVEEAVEEIIPEIEATEEIMVEKPTVEEIAEQEQLLIQGAEEQPVVKNLQDTAALEQLIREEVLASEESVPEESVKSVEDSQETIRKIQKAQEEIRELTEEEKALFAPFIQTKGARRRFMKALDLISLAAYTGNVIVTGEADSDTVKLAKNIMKDIQMTDANFSGVIAKVSGASLNSKSVEGTVAKLNNGGLIIEKASEMNSQAVMKLLKALNQEKTGIVVILEDSKKAMKRMLAAYPSMNTFFNARIEVEELNNDALAAYGRQYAAHLEYSIDELGMLALQTQIEDRQTSDHIVTVAEVRELVDGAIAHANRKNLGHFFDIILGKRYDEEDMIILREKDFY